MITHIISDTSCTVILKGVVYAVSSDQPTYEPLIDAIRAGDDTQVERIATTHKRLIALLDYFGDSKFVDGELVRGGGENILVDDVLNNLHGNFYPALEKAEKVLGL